MDWQLTCRVCLETGDMVSLFDWDENNEMLGDKYTYCCGVEISKNDPLPTLICLSCVDRLTFAYQFKQQCVSSNDTLKECLEEYQNTTEAVNVTKAASKLDTEIITIKQENGVLLQYELPVEHENTVNWTRTMTKSSDRSVVTKAPQPRKRGRPRKYPNEQGQIEVSPYTRKKPKSSQEETQALTTLLASGMEFKQEQQSEPEHDADDKYEDEDYLTNDDPDFDPEEEEEEETTVVTKQQKKRGRPRKTVTKVKKEADDGEDVLLKETILAFSEPIPDHILNPKPKEKKKYPRKKYTYDKTHVCETCGAAFTSNASLQAHIRRHLGIKPFVCSVCGYACVLNMELRRHMLRHTGVRPYKCRVCDRRFGDFGTRQKHERLHMGLRPYQCSLCGKAFTYSYVLANHMLTHTGEKKYSCAPCNKKFTKAHHLKYHNKVHHKELYIQQQMEAEAKKVRQQITVSGLSSVLAGQIVDGTIQIMPGNEGDGEIEEQMQVVEEADSSEERETSQAVADMQAPSTMLKISKKSAPRVRKYGTKTNYTEAILNEAIENVKHGALTLRKAGKIYKIPKSTLCYKMKSMHSKKVGRPIALTVEEEILFRDYLLSLSDLGTPISMKNFKSIVKRYLDKENKSIPQFKNNTPGWDWGRLYLERHPELKKVL